MSSSSSKRTRSPDARVLPTLSRIKLEPDEFLDELLRRDQVQSRMSPLLTPTRYILNSVGDEVLQGEDPFGFLFNKEIQEELEENATDCFPLDLNNFLKQSIFSPTLPSGKEGSLDKWLDATGSEKISEPVVRAELFEAALKQGLTPPEEVNIFEESFGHRVDDANNEAEWYGKFLSEKPRPRKHPEQPYFVILDPPLSLQYKALASPPLPLYKGDKLRSAFYIPLKGHIDRNESIWKYVAGTDSQSYVTPSVEHWIQRTSVQKTRAQLQGTHEMTLNFSLVRERYKYYNKVKEERKVELARDFYHPELYFPVSYPHPPLAHPNLTFLPSAPIWIEFLFRNRDNPGKLSASLTTLFSHFLNGLCLALTPPMPLVPTNMFHKPYFAMRRLTDGHIIATKPEDIPHWIKKAPKVSEARKSLEALIDQSEEEKSILEKSLPENKLIKVPFKSTSDVNQLPRFRDLLREARIRIVGKYFLTNNEFQGNNRSRMLPGPFFYNSQEKPRGFFSTNISTDGIVPPVLCHLISVSNSSKPPDAASLYEPQPKLIPASGSQTASATAQSKLPLQNPLASCSLSRSMTIKPSSYISKSCDYSSSNNSITLQNQYLGNKRISELEAPSFPSSREVPLYIRPNTSTPATTKVSVIIPRQKLTQEEKRQRLLERNRISASKSRRKKKEELNWIEETIACYEQHLTTIRAQKLTLTQQKMILLRNILRHGKCDKCHVKERLDELNLIHGER